MLYTAILVDDDTVNNFINEKLLANSGRFAPLITFSSPTEAYEHIKTKCLELHKNSLANLLLIDVNMPIIDGFEFIEKMREVCPDILGQTILCLLSNSTHQRDTDRAKSLGTDFYLTKPLKENDIKNLIGLLEEKHRLG